MTFCRVFRYVAADGQLCAVNVLQLSGLPLDQAVSRIILPSVPRSANVNNFEAGDSSEWHLLNTDGYRFLQRQLTERNQWGVRLDFEATPRAPAELFVDP